MKTGLLEIEYAQQAQNRSAQATALENDARLPDILTHMQASLSAPQDCYGAVNCILELLGNSLLYTPAHFAHEAAQEVTYDPETPDRLHFVSSGVINETKWQNLSGKISLTRGKSAQELSALRNEFIVSGTGSGQLGSRRESRGASLGILTIAAACKTPVQATRTTQIALDLYRFVLFFDFLLRGQLQKTAQAKTITLHIAP